MHSDSNEIACYNKHCTHHISKDGCVAYGEVKFRPIKTLGINSGALKCLSFKPKEKRLVCQRKA